MLNLLGSIIGIHLSSLFWTAPHQLGATFQARTRQTNLSVVLFPSTFSQRLLVNLLCNLSSDLKNGSMRGSRLRAFRRKLSRLPGENKVLHALYPRRSQNAALGISLSCKTRSPAQVFPKVHQALHLQSHRLPILLLRVRFLIPGASPFN